MKTKKDLYEWEQKVVVLCLLTIMLVGVAAYLTISLTDSADQTSGTLMSQHHNSTAIKTTPQTGKYLNVKEMGVNLPVLVGLEHLSYSVNTDKKTGVVTASFSDTDLDAVIAKSQDVAAKKYCLTKNSYLGVLSKFKGYPDGDDRPMRKDTYIVGDSYVAFETPQDSCTLDKSLQTTIDKKINLIRESYLQLQTADGKALSYVQQGTITGSLGYPSEGIPSEMKTCAELTDGSKSYCQSAHLIDKKFTFGEGFSLTVPVGNYYVYSTLASDPRDPKADRAYYDKVVTCGLAVGCNDKTKIVVKVTDGSEVSGIDPQDWY